jgi:Xaa-Pro aminopeptidase
LEEEPAVVAPIDEADLIMDCQSWIDDIWFYGKSKVEIGEPEEPPDQTKNLIKMYKTARSESEATSALVKALDEKNLLNRVIAIDTLGLTPSLYKKINLKLQKAKLVEGADILREIRRVKTKGELERIKRATSITEKSMEDALEITREEISELDMASMYAYSVAYDGGQVTQNLIGFRERSAFPNPVPSIIEAKRRDLVRMTLGCTWDHYHSNVSRTAVIGRPLQKVQRRWEAVISAQDAILESIRPGVKISEIYKIALKELEKRDIKGFNANIGHSLGVECNEFPWLQRDSDEELLEGMVINIDIPILELGWGGIQIEDTTLVTSDGFELLTNSDRSLYLL